MQGMVTLGHKNSFTTGSESGRCLLSNVGHFYKWGTIVLNLGQGVISKYLEKIVVQKITF